MIDAIIDYDTGQVIDRKDPPKEWLVEHLAVEFARIVKARKKKVGGNDETNAMQQDYILHEGFRFDINT